MTQSCIYSKTSCEGPWRSDSDSGIGSGGGRRWGHGSCPALLQFNQMKFGENMPFFYKATVSCAWLDL